jgi:hypothetical protein
VTIEDGIPEVSGVSREGFGVREWKSQYTLTFYPTNIWARFKTLPEDEGAKVQFFRP